MSRARVWFDAEDYDDGSASACSKNLENADWRASICGDELFFIPRWSSVPSTALYHKMRDVGNITHLWSDSDGMLYLIGQATAAQYTQALRSVLYHPSMDLSLYNFKNPIVKRINLQVHDVLGMDTSIEFREISLTTAARVYTDTSPMVIAV